MERYTPDYDLVDVMDKAQYGDWVRYDAAQAEIARLNAELTEARESLRLAVKSADLADAAIDTAWNDAIEASVKKLDDMYNAYREWGEFQKCDALDIAETDIRALRRPT